VGVADPDFEHEVEFLKFDDQLGLAFGFAIICKVDGEEYFDLQNQSVPEPVMLEAATEFMLNSRMADQMHDYQKQGTVVFAFPLTTEIAKRFGIKTDVTGLMIAMKPNEEMLAKFRSGELRAFSIGGRGALQEVTP
jgi:hypothetical protein